MNLFRNLKQISFIILLLGSQDVTSGISDLLDGISSAVDKKLSENGIKPYIIPLDQGRLIESERLQKIDVGLTKEQIIYLIGKPPLESPFLDNQWTYIYYNNSDVKKPKKLSILFKNEKAFEIFINNIPFRKLGIEEYSQVTLDNAPLKKSEIVEQMTYGPIIVDAGNNNLTSNVADICNINDFETFAAPAPFFNN